MGETDQRHCIMGTAGHIDHGKTALVRSLTGFDCDTHSEEKKRGITIHLGFTHLDLGEGSVGIVDVPGHAAFVKTMVAGTCGIDFCLLVVAADSGVMPQTREHLQIMNILGVRGGLIALTKMDLVSSDIADMAEDEIRELTEKTFLEGCPVVRVSSRTGAGLDLLRAEILKQMEQVPLRAAGEVFRMFIDRIFTIKGFGTVVNGSVTSGNLETGSAAFVLPLEKEVRVRRMERHGQECTLVQTGDRASLNLVGLDRNDYARGMLVSDRILKSTLLVDARVTLFSHARGQGIWGEAVFFLGTYEAQVRIHLIDRNSLDGSESGLVQIHLPQPCVIQAGDRFVLRNTSNDITLGGGVIIDPFPLHHRRRPAVLINTMKTLADGALPQLIEVEIGKRMLAVSTQDLADVLNMAPADIESAVNDLDAQRLRVVTTVFGNILVGNDTAEKWVVAAEETVRNWHCRNPLVAYGRTISQLAGALGFAGDKTSEAALETLLDERVNKGTLKRVGATFAAADHSVVLSHEQQLHLAFVKQSLTKSGLQVPLMTELVPAAKKQGIDEKELKRLLVYLVNIGEAYSAEGSYLDAVLVDKMRGVLLDALPRYPQGITVAEFRNLIGGNRKICLLLLGIFDAEGTTERRGDQRVAGSRIGHKGNV